MGRLRPRAASPSNGWPPGAAGRSAGVARNSQAVRFEQSAAADGPRELRFSRRRR
jgi:hypothetical protein